MLYNRQSEVSFTIVATGAACVMQLDYSTQIKVLFFTNKERWLKENICCFVILNF